jgi:hypothetical protein
MNGTHQFPRRAFKVGVAALSAVLLSVNAIKAVEPQQAADPKPMLDVPAKPSSEQEVGDFSLLDQNGKFHQLRRAHGKKAVVLMVAGNGCPIVRQNIPKLKALRDQFPKVAFWMLNLNPQDDVASIVAEANEFDAGVPVLKDEAQIVGRSLGVKRTAEIIAISTKDWKVFYRGALDDQMVQGAVKAKVSEPYLENALRAFLSGKPVPTASTAAAGCLIHYDLALDVPDDQISYAKHIAPILERGCVNCHSMGNIGPFAMSSYSKVRGFSDQIREEILVKRMPPWSADPHYGVFQGDRSLTVAETQTLIRWIDAGLPRGDGADPLVELAKTQAKPDTWELGQPDYIVTPSHPMEVPATGVVDYITNVVDCPVPTDAWLKGAVVRPDNKKVLHHVIVYLEYPDGHKDQDRWENKWLVGWAPGAKSSFYPPGTGKFLPKGSKLRFQLHYTPYGKEATDLTEIGLYLHDKPPRLELEIRGVGNGDFKIPPHNPDSHTLAILDFPRDTVVYELFPHMHKRGSWFRYEALYPDGKFETLLSVPRYNFGWQTTYRFNEPKRFPAGTRVLCTGGFDNSKDNPDNPDPEKTVHWGDQSFDEMFIGFMSVSDPPPRPDAGQQQAKADN